MTQRRILFISHSSGLDGSTRALFDTVRLLDLNRFSCRVVFPHEGTAPSLFTNRGIALEWCPLPLFHFFEAQGRSQIQPHLFLREAIRFLVHTRELLDICRRFNPELVVLNSSTLVASAFLLKCWKIPFVWHDREVMAQGAFWGKISRRLVRWMASSAKIVIPMSHFAASVFNGAKNARPIWGGVDLDFFSPSRDSVAAKKSLGISPEVPTLGFLGRLTEEKGFCDFVKAILIALHSMPSLRVIAVGETWAKLPAILRDLKLDKIFLLTRFREDVRPFLEAMDVAVFPPPQPEGFGLALAEAMAMERAVIATDLGPAREIVEDGRSGVLVPLRDPVRLAEAIVGLLRDPDRRKKLGKAARERIREKFDIHKLVLETQSVYEEVIESVTSAEVVSSVPVEVGKEVEE